MHTYSEPRVAGVIGWPVSHSLSPLLHSYWLREHGLTGSYVHLPVAPGQLEAALRGLPALGFVGANVTAPYKEQVAARVDSLTARAQQLGAVNTLIVEPSGALLGECTDGVGFVGALAQCGYQPGGPALVLGAGGAARAVLKTLAELGVRELRVAARRSAQVQALATQLELDLLPIEWDAASAACAGCSLLVNTTPLGMAGHAPLELALTDLPATALVFDLIYRPCPTPLLQRAAARGNAVCDGLEMLMHQAAPAFAAWFGVQPHVSAGLRAHLRAAL